MRNFDKLRNISAAIFALGCAAFMGDTVIYSLVGLALLAIGGIGTAYCNKNTPEPDERA